MDTTRLIIIMGGIIVFSLIIRLILNPKRVKKEAEQKEYILNRAKERDEQGQLHLDVPEPEQGESDPEFGTLQFIIKTRKQLQIAGLVCLWTLGPIAVASFVGEYSKEHVNISVLIYRIAAVFISILLVMMMNRKIYFYRDGIKFKKTFSIKKAAYNDVLDIKKSLTSYNRSSSAVSDYSILLKDNTSIVCSGLSFQHIDYHIDLYQKNLHI